MTTSVRIAAAALTAVLVGCSSIKIGLDFDPQVDFTRFTTFDWLENRPGARAGAGVQENPFADDRVRTAVESELASKGLERDEQAPDLLVTYHVGADAEIDAAAWGYRYREAYGSWSGDIRARVYRAGALVIDLVDPADMSLVWRGSANDVLGRTLGRTRIEDNIDEAVVKMLSGYPPAR